MRLVLPIAISKSFAFIYRSFSSQCSHLPQPHFMILIYISLWVVLLVWKIDKGLNKFETWIYVLNIASYLWHIYYWFIYLISIIYLFLVCVINFYTCFDCICNGFGPLSSFASISRDNSLTGHNLLISSYGKVIHCVTNPDQFYFFHTSILE